MKQLYKVPQHVVSKSTHVLPVASEKYTKIKCFSIFTAISENCSLEEFFYKKKQTRMIVVPVQNHPIYEKQRMTVSEPRCTDHQQWQCNTKFSVQWSVQVLPNLF
jgi:hypothetical protein